MAKKKMIFPIEMPTALVPQNLTPVQTALILLNRLREFKLMFITNYRQYRPHTPSDQFTITYHHEEQRHFWVVVVDENGAATENFFSTYEETKEFKAQLIAEGYEQQENNLKLEKLFKALESCDVQLYFLA